LKRRRRRLREGLVDAGVGGVEGEGPAIRERREERGCQPHPLVLCSGSEAGSYLRLIGCAVDPRRARM